MGSTGGAALFAGMLALGLLWAGIWMLRDPAYWSKVASPAVRGEGECSPGALGRWRVWGSLVIASGLAFAAYSAWCVLSLFN